LCPFNPFIPFDPYFTLFMLDRAALDHNGNSRSGWH